MTSTIWQSEETRVQTCGVVAEIKHCDHCLFFWSFKGKQKKYFIHIYMDKRKWSLAHRSLKLICLGTLRCSVLPITMIIKAMSGVRLTHVIICVLESDAHSLGPWCRQNRQKQILSDIHTVFDMVKISHAPESVNYAWLVADLRQYFYIVQTDMRIMLPEPDVTKDKQELWRICHLKIHLMVMVRRKDEMRFLTRPEKD